VGCMRATRARLAAVLFALTTAPAAAVPDGTPEIFLKAIYDQYIGKGSAYGITLDTSEQMSVFFEPSLVELMVADETTAAIGEDIPLWAIDPFVHVPAWDIPSFDIHVVHQDPDHAVGTVVFRNKGKVEIVRLQLVQRSGAWRIADIIWDDGTSLRGLYAGCRLVDRGTGVPATLDCSGAPP